MDRLRYVVFEISVIVLVGVAVAVPASFVIERLRGPSIEDFKREYAKAGTPDKQVPVAEKYFDAFSLPELVHAVEEEYSERICHSEAHALGRVVYRRNPNFTEAVRQCGAQCTYGCFHGVMLEMFKTDSDTLGGVINDESSEAYTRRVLELAKDICYRPDVASVVQVRQCLHGLGHMFVYKANGNLRAATDECDTLFEPNAARSCRSGAFMEKIDSATSTSREYLLGKEPCDAYPEDGYICLRNKAFTWLYLHGSVAAALKACDGFGERMYDCLSATGAAKSTPELLSTNEGIASICGSLDGRKRQSCETGIFLNMLHLNEGDDSAHACDVVAPDYRDLCLWVRWKYGGQIYYANPSATSTS